MFPRIYTKRKYLDENAPWDTVDLRDSMTYEGFGSLCLYLQDAKNDYVSRFVANDMREFFSNVTINGVKIGEMSPDLAIKHIIAGLIYGRILNTQGNLDKECKLIENEGDTKEFFEKLKKYTDRLFEQARGCLESQTAESKALDLSGKAVVASDIHCDYNEMMQIIQKSEGSDHIIFSGDTLGHSYKTPEDTYITMFTMLLHQICDPRVKFLRGNHEVTTLLDYTDLGLRDNPYLREQIQSVWNRMPICARVKTIAPAAAVAPERESVPEEPDANATQVEVPEAPIAQAAVPAQQIQQSQSVFVSHAGIPRKAITFEELRELPVMKQREITPSQILEAKTQGSGQVVFDMLYSDPGKEEQHPDRRGHLSFSSVFSNSHIDKLSGTQYSEFADKSGMTTFVRGHSHPLAGVTRDGEKLITVASSSKLEKESVQAKVIVIDGDIKSADTRVDSYIQRAQKISLEELKPDSHRSETESKRIFFEDFEEKIRRHVARSQHVSSDQNRKLYISAFKNFYNAYTECISRFVADQIGYTFNSDPNIRHCAAEELFEIAYPMLNDNQIDYFKHFLQNPVDYRSGAINRLSSYIFGLLDSTLQKGAPLESLASENRTHSVIRLFKDIQQTHYKSFNIISILELESVLQHAMLESKAKLARYSSVDSEDFSSAVVDASIKSKSFLLDVCRSVKLRDYDIHQQHEYLTEDGFLVPKSDSSLDPDDVLDESSWHTGWLPWINTSLQMRDGQRPVGPLPVPELSDILQSETAHPYGESIAMYQEFIEKLFQKHGVDGDKKDGALKPESYAHEMYYFIINSDTFTDNVLKRYDFYNRKGKKHVIKAAMLSEIRNWKYGDSEIEKAKRFVLENIGLSESDFFRKLENDNSDAFPQGSSFVQRKYLADAAFSKIIAEFPVYTIDKPAVFIHATNAISKLLDVESFSDLKVGHEFTPSTYLCVSNGSIAHHDCDYRIRVKVPAHAGFIPAAADFFEGAEIRFPIHTRFKVTAIDSVSGVVTVEPCNLPIADDSSRTIARMIDTQDAFHSRLTMRRLQRTEKFEITDRLSVADERIIPDILTVVNESIPPTGASSTKKSERIVQIEESLRRDGIDPDDINLRYVRDVLALPSTKRFVLNLPRDLNIVCSRSLEVRSMLDTQRMIIDGIQIEIEATQSLIDIYKKRVSQIHDIIDHSKSQMSLLEIEQRRNVLQKLNKRIGEFNSDLSALIACKDMFKSSDFKDMLTSFHTLVSEGGYLEVANAYQMFKDSQEIIKDENLSIDKKRQAILRFNALKLVLIRNNIIDADCNLTSSYKYLSSGTPILSINYEIITDKERDFREICIANINRTEDNDLDNEMMLAVNLEMIHHDFRSYWTKNYDKMTQGAKIEMMEKTILPIQKNQIAQNERVLRMMKKEDAISIKIKSSLFVYLESLKEYLKLIDGNAEKRQNTLKEISLVYKKLIDSKYCNELSPRDKEEFLQEAKKYVFETCSSLSRTVPEEERNLFSNLLVQIDDQLTFALSDRSQNSNLYSTLVGQSTKFTVDGTNEKASIIKDTLNRESRRFDENQARKALKALELECIEQRRSLEPWEYRAVALKSLGSDGYKERGMVREFMDRAEKCGFISKMPNSDLTASATYDILRARGRLHPIGLSPERAQKTLEYIGIHLKENGYIYEENLIQFVRFIGSTRSEAARIFAELSAADSKICKRGAEYTSPRLLQQSVTSPLAIHPPNQDSNALAAPPAPAVDAAPDADIPDAAAPATVQQSNIAVLAVSLDGSAVAPGAQTGDLLDTLPPPPPIETATPPAPIQTAIDWHRPVVPVNMG